jgi:hypothetical protein
MLCLCVAIVLHGSGVCNRLKWRVDAEAQIPPRRAAHHTPTFEASSRDVLGVKPQTAYPGTWIRVLSGARNGSGKGMLVTGCAGP